MKVDMNQLLTDITGEETMKLPAGVDPVTEKPKTKPATLRAIIQDALGSPIKGDESMSDDERYKLFRLGKRLNADVVHLSAAEIVIINTRCSKHFLSAYVYGQVRDMLEPPVEDAVAEPKPNGADNHVN